MSKHKIPNKQKDTDEEYKKNVEAFLLSVSDSVEESNIIMSILTGENHEQV